MEEQLSKSEIKRKIINAAVEEYITTSEFDKSIVAIAKKYGINKKTLTKYLKDRNIPIKANHGAKYLNYTIFDNIDSEEKAYWLGFLYADGYIAKNNNQIGLGLALKDLEHMQKYKNFIGWGGDIKIQETHQFRSKSHYNKTGELLQMCRIIVTNEHMHKSLDRLGCVPNKSLILTFPTNEQVPEQFKLAFIRGYFDGDGSLGYYVHSKKDSKKSESLCFVGTKPFLEKVQEYLGIGNLYQKKNCNLATYKLQYSGSRANKAAELMYKNATIYLDRKYNIYINDFTTKNRAKSVNPEIGNTEVNN